MRHPRVKADSRASRIMGSICDLAKNETLTKVSLHGLAWSEIPFFSDKTQLTPLGIAVWNGPVDVARLLFDYKTEPNGNRQDLPPISRSRRARFAGRYSCPPITDGCLKDDFDSQKRPQAASKGVQSQRGNQKLRRQAGRGRVSPHR
ncbi:hypothetical protein MY3296_002427 [Beauveria thailandica]